MAKRFHSHKNDAARRAKTERLATKFVELNRLSLGDPRRKRIEEDIRQIKQQRSSLKFSRFNASLGRFTRESANSSRREMTSLDFRGSGPAA